MGVEIIVEIVSRLHKQQKALDEIKVKLNKISGESGSGLFGAARGITLIAIYSKLTELEKLLKKH